MSKYFSRLLELPRTRKIWLMRLIDSLVLGSAFFYVTLIQLAKLGFNQRNMGVLLNVDFRPFLMVGLCSLLVATLVLKKAGFYRWQVRFLNFPVFNSLVVAMLCSAITLYFTSWLFSASLSLFTTVNYFALGLIGLIGVRAMAVIALDSRSAEQGVIIVGADRQGLQLAQALLYSSYRQPVAFIDADPQLHNTVIFGIPVYSLTEVNQVVEKFINRYPELSICLSRGKVSSSERQLLLEQVSDYPLSIEYLDHHSDQVVAGRQLIDSVKPFEITELLGRDAIPPVPDFIRSAVSEQVVMVTGAGGSIGSELVRQIAAEQPARLILVEVSEFALYQILQELGRRFPDVDVRGVLLDICKPDQLHDLIQQEQVSIVYHAAAYKHVPLVEDNIRSGLENNVLGTQAVLESIRDTTVKRFTLISTDKAVRPTNIMGASKRIAELLVLAEARQNPQINYSMVRFGNVLGSSGSVVPLFKQQIAAGGPVTVTNREVTRFFMTISEAAQLVIQSSALAQGGDIFLLDMGEPVRIYDLARRMIHLMGRDIRDDKHPSGIEIREVGLRKGEKLYEELLVDPRSAQSTSHPRIFRAVEPEAPASEIEVILQAIRKYMDGGDTDCLKAALALPLVNYAGAD